MIIIVIYDKVKGKKSHSRENVWTFNNTGCLSYDLPNIVCESLNYKNHL
jgi:hypothetical protein